MWSLDVLPKIKQHMWRLLHDALPTLDNLALRNIDIDSNACTFCGHMESLHHHLFDCHFARQIWLLAGLHTEVYDLRCDCPKLWISEFLVNRSKEQCVTFVTFCYNLWYARNQQFFHHESISAQGIQSISISMMQGYQMSMLPKQTIGGIKFDHSRSHQHAEQMMIYFDGATSKNTNSSAIGVWICDASGKFIGGLAKTFGAEFDPLVTEALAAREGISFALSKQLPQIRLIGDSLSVINGINDEEGDLSDVGMIIQDVKALFVNFQLVDAHWIRRDKNMPAHILAQYAKSKLDFEQIWDTIPEFVPQSVLDDFPVH